MTQLTHRGFVGSVKWEGGKLFIEVLYVDDTLVAECLDASMVRETFEQLIEDYLETCELVGKEPCRPFKGSFNVRVRPELHKQAALAAASCDQSLNAWVSDAISEKLNQKIFVREVLLQGIRSRSSAKALGLNDGYTASDRYNPDFRPSEIRRSHKGH
jgi:predicted HicB family RNase H-like nuclease